MKINAKNKLIPAIVMLIVAAVMMSSASYAWFTMSRTVKATGINLTAVAPTNLLISNAFEGTYGETTTVTENFELSRLIPASTVDGINFDAPRQITAANAGAPDEDTTWDNVTGKNIKPSEGDVKHDGYYADFKLWLKTEGDDDVNVTISRIAELTNIVDTVDAAPDITPAVRFAVLDGAAETPAVFTGTKAIYAFDKDYFATVTGPITDPTVTDGWKGVDATTGDALLTDGTTIFTVAGGGTPKAIVVRVWIEGQDLECVNENAKAEFDMSVGFSDVLYGEGVSE